MKIHRPPCGVTKRVRWFPLPSPLPTRADIAPSVWGALLAGSVRASRSTKNHSLELLGQGVQSLHGGHEPSQIAHRRAAGTAKVL